MDDKPRARPRSSSPQDQLGGPGRSLSSPTGGETAPPELSPPPPITVRGLLESGETTQLDQASLPRRAAGENAGFELLEEVGRGGMGVVYRARQESLRRDVAIKKTRSGADVGRFLSEALVTAYLDHPNIVPVYDLGTGPDGEAMMAMKLVGGTEWARLIHPRSPEDQERAAGLELEDHIRILLGVCNAVRLAHDRGLAHLDIKPDNVRVGDYGEVFLLDWGIAVDIRPLDALTEGEPRTGHHSRIATPCGTPSYMAPELAQGDGARVGPRTDVFLLGAILFELLEGRPPHRDEGVWRTIARASLGPDVSFTRPSPRDLRQICRRALRVEPAERQPSVRAFSEDLEGYLRHKESREVSERGRELLAAASSASRRDLAYRDLAEAAAVFRQALTLWQGNEDARRGEREARLTYAGAALDGGDLGLAEAQAGSLDPEAAETRALQGRIAEARRGLSRQAARSRALRVLALSALGAAMIGGVLSYVRTERARIRERELSILARVAADRARRNEADARRSVKRAIRSEIEALRRLDGNRKAFDVVLFGVRDRLETVADERVRLLRQQLLEEAHGVLEELEAAASSPGPGLARYRVASLQQLAEFAELSGRSDQALRHYQEALRIGRELLDRETGTALEQRQLRQSVALALGKLGRLHRRRGHLAEALAVLRESRQMHRALVAEDGQRLSYQRGLGTSLDRLGRALVDRGDLDGALATARESLEIRRRLSREDPSSSLRLDDLGVSFGRVGEYLFRAGRLEEALAHREDALKVYRGLVALDPSNALYLRSLAVSLSQRGQILERMGNVLGALAAEEESLKLRRDLARRDPGHTRYARDVSVSLDRLGDLERGLGRGASALARSRESLDIARSLAARDSKNLGWTRDLELSLRKFGRGLIRAGRAADAAAPLEEALAIARELAEREPASLQFLRDLAAALDLLGGLRFDLGEEVIAQGLMEEGLALRERAVIRAPNNDEVLREKGVAQENLAQLLHARGRLDRAIALYQEATTAARRLAERSPSSARLLEDLRTSLVKLGAARQAAGELEAAATLCEEALRLARRLTAAAPESEGQVLELVYVLARLGQIRGDQGQRDACFALLEEGRRLGRRALDADPKNAVSRRRLAALLNALGFHRARAGLIDEAEAAYREAAETMRPRTELADSLPREQATLRAALTGLAYTRAKRGRPDEALAAADESLALARRLQALRPRGSRALELYACLDTCRRLRQKLGDYPEALALAREAAKLAADITRGKASFADEQGAADRRAAVLEALLHREELIAGRRKVEGPEDALVLGQHHYEAGRYRRAAERYREGLPPQGPDKADPHLLFAARSAAMASRQQAAWRSQSLEWLARYRSVTRRALAERAAALELASEAATKERLRSEIDGLRGFLVELRDKDPLLAPLRGSAGFNALFGED